MTAFVPRTQTPTPQLAYEARKAPGGAYHHNIFHQSEHLLCMLREADARGEAPSTILWPYAILPWTAAVRNKTANGIELKTVSKSNRVAAPKLPRFYSFRSLCASCCHTQGSSPRAVAKKTSPHRGGRASVECAHAGSECVQAAPNLRPKLHSGLAPRGEPRI